MDFIFKCFVEVLGEFFKNVDFWVLRRVRFRKFIFLI